MMQQSSVKAAKGRKLNSLEVKYMRFCVDTHSAEEPKLPVLENFNLVNLMLFGLWCAHNGVKSGYDGVSNYIAAAVKMAGRFEVKDPRKASAQAEWWWADYVFKFKRNVQAVRRPKLKVQPAHHQAIAADFDVEHDAEDRRDAQEGRGGLRILDVLHLQDRACGASRHTDRGARGEILRRGVQAELRSADKRFRAVKIYKNKTRMRG